MRCRSLKWTSLFTYSSNQLKFVFDVAYDETMQRDKVMAPMVKSLNSCIKDSNHALEILRNFNFSGENKIIFITEITSLYTVIQSEE